MTDQQRFDTISALGNPLIHTPNLDRLVRRGVSFANAYSTCPVCVPARYIVRTGCEPFTTGIYQNGAPSLVSEQADSMEERCGTYLARRMGQLGYRTFGVGKFHSIPRTEDLGYEVHLRTEEIYSSVEDRRRDAYADFIEREHPAYDFVGQLHGERSDMYYMPQTSALPAALTVEAYVADRAIEQIRAEDSPYFGFVSFIGPHPPFAPPIPYNRLYDPDNIPMPVRGTLESDHLDDQIPWGNYFVWAEDINDSHARVLKARYYGEITYIDACVGKILDAVESRPDADNTLICFFSDHGDHLGDHSAWQKESFFDASCHIPMLLSWPNVLPTDTLRQDLVCLTDLFGIATSAGGESELRDGIDVMAILNGQTVARELLFGHYGIPGTRQFKVMVRDSKWKYIFMANGAREQLFDLETDPDETTNQISHYDDVAIPLRQAACDRLNRTNINRALDGQTMLAFPFESKPLKRVYQFDPSRGVQGFPDHPGDVLKELQVGI